MQGYVFIIQQMIEKNHNNNIYIAFVDLENGFDIISRKKSGTS